VGDPDLLARVWVNILANAVKFTPPGGAVRVSGREADGRAEVTVEDTGVGIAAEDLGRIFERFYKGDKARTRTDSEAGSGLGLAITKRILDLSGGGITVGSAPGTGTTVTVSLPGAGPDSRAPGRSRGVHVPFTEAPHDRGNRSRRRGLIEAPGDTRREQP
jgi:two-component system phosphate regulon sensor histidine kinase PhoR